MSKKIITVIGARPQIIKAAALSRAIQKNFNNQLIEILVHTGQHYDENMSEVFFSEMGIPEPHYNLACGSGTHGAMTAKMLAGLEEVLLKESPDAVVVYGDTNSTLAGALAASKLHIPVVHVEAGLRSFNKTMPEEINRIACDHMSTLLFTPTSAGRKNLEREGFLANTGHQVDIDHPAVFHCGDVMYDNSLYFAEKATRPIAEITEGKITSEPFILCTVHRDSNTDHPAHLEAIFSGLLQIQQLSGHPIILPIHPRTRSKMSENLSFELQEELKKNGKIQVINPAGFLDMIALERAANLVITDSGGVQKEAYFFQKPCIILREETEWVEIVESGAAVLTGADEQKMVKAYQQFTRNPVTNFPAIFGNGRASEFIGSKILELLK